MLCSTIIPTIGRPALQRAVESVLAQDLPASALEVIVVNDSGVPLPEADWQSSKQVQIINTNRRERSIARNTGAAAAKGQFLHFLDDDDWLFPNVYQYLEKLSNASSAKWLYGMTQLVNRQNDPLIQLRHDLKGNCFIQAMAGEWIPLQASWIERTTFMRVGGFNPLLAGPEDIDLQRRILLEEDVAETSNLIVNVIMGGEGSTTDYDRHPQASRAARENILNLPNVFQRMEASANNPTWHGRMTRVYLTSAVWNLQRRYWTTAASRGLFAIASLLNTGVFLADFWRAVLRPYASSTFEAGLQEASASQ